MPLTLDELHDLTNAIDLAIGAYSPEDTRRLALEYRPGTAGHARLVALVPRLLDFMEPA